MRFKLRKCLSCKKYTMKNTCEKCNKQTVLAHPAKFSPDDRYLKLRIVGKQN